MNGDSTELVKASEPDSIDAIVTDPPYELGFMGKSWDRSGVAFDPYTWWEMLRVLKPGGHMLVFGGSRTFHRIAVAIEDAGFEIRDVLTWLYGSGFPKSHDISKAIDKAAGAEREVVGSKLGQPGYSLAPERNNGNRGDVYEWANGKSDPARECEITAPATPEAEQWDGWGTALKPAYEPIILARKPFKTTVAKNVIAYGTGALNIDDCRIGVDGGHKLPDDVKGSDVGSVHALGGHLNSVQSPPVEGLGRWPANVLMDAEAAALLDEQSGERKSNNGKGVWATGKQGYEGGFGPSDSPAYGDTGGASRFFKTAIKTLKELREDAEDPGRWPANVVLDEESAALLDAQSGASKSVGGSRGAGGQNGRYGPINAQPEVKPGYGDTGGASRFFYCAKASRKERELGLEDFEPVTFVASNGGQAADSRDEDYEAAISIGLNKPKTVRNPHPTVKPVSLMRWLVRLITPPDGLVLDPFCGSGTTGIAATLEGFDFVGMDLTPEYCAIAERRIAAWLEKASE